MAYSTRVRMLSLEPAILDAIVNDHLTPAVVLLRSHSETAGLACFALLTLRGAALERLFDYASQARADEARPEKADAIGGCAGRGLGAVTQTR
jgi:hypothetical protein